MREAAPGAMAEVMTTTGQGAFSSDIAAIRKRAREHIDQGALTPNYGGDVETSVRILNEALATEIVCVLRYRFHAITATGINSEGVRDEFEQHAREEEQHMLWLAERINQLGGKPNFNPEGLTQRSASQFVEGCDLIDMIKENLVAERIAIETYRDMIQHFAGHDPTTRRLLEQILAVEEEHANDMHDLLTARECPPTLGH